MMPLKRFSVLNGVDQWNSCGGDLHCEYSYNLSQWNSCTNTLGKNAYLDCILNVYNIGTVISWNNFVININRRIAQDWHENRRISVVREFTTCSMTGNCIFSLSLSVGFSWCVLVHVLFYNFANKKIEMAIWRYIVSLLCNHFNSTENVQLSNVHYQYFVIVSC